MRWRRRCSPAGWVSRPDCSAARLGGCLVMQNTTPNVIEQQPAGGGVNKPASGTYGEKASVDRLKQELPSTGSQPQPVQPAPSAAGGGLAAPAAPSSLPKGLVAPSVRPGVPVSTPLAGAAGAVDPFAGAVDARQRRLRYLDLLAQQADSPEVREWAEIVKQKLIERG
jgi:hypothetical protein